MTSGHEMGGRYREDPVGAESRGKNRERRKHRNDGPTLTPTEKHMKDGLMKQFCKLEGSTNSEAYRNSPAWCSGCNGRRLAGESGFCADCASKVVIGGHLTQEEKRQLVELWKEAKPALQSFIEVLKDREALEGLDWNPK